MRPLVVVVAPREMQRLASVRQSEDHFHVQAFVPQLAIEALDRAGLSRLARLDEVQMHAVPGGPEIQRLQGKLHTVVHRNRSRSAAQRNDLVERHSHLLAAQSAVRMQSHTLARELVDHGQLPHPATIGQPLRDKVLTPFLIRPGLLTQRHTLPLRRFLCLRVRTINVFSR